MSHGDADHGAWIPRSNFYDQGRFGRLFPTLPPFALDTPSVRAALTKLGKPGGLMDAADDTGNPLTLITDAALSADNPDNPRLSAGMTFLGQFLDHDMTFDPTSSLARTQDPESIRNFRIPALDLDSGYGGGPGVSPQAIRTLTMEVPSGQRVAAAMQETPLSDSALAELEPYGLQHRTPLWFYVLKEAEVLAGGQRLGPVGGRIVAEVFPGLIEGDPSSYLAQDPDVRHRRYVRDH